MWLAVAGIVTLSFALSSLGFFFAWKLDSVQGFHSIMNVVLMPLWLLSGAFFPYANASPAVRWLMLLNPLSYGLNALKIGLYGQEIPFATGAIGSLAVTTAFGLLFLALSAGVVSKTTEVRT